MQALLIPFKQLHTDLLFQLLHMATDRALRKIQFMGRSCDRSAPCNCFERGEPRKRR
jgi:hypothetical protein